VNAALFRVILTESGVNPRRSRSRIQPGPDRRDAAHPSIDAFMMVGPLESKLTSDAIISTARIRGEPTFYRSTFPKPRPQAPALRI